MKISKLLCTALAGLVVSTAVSEARYTTAEARAKMGLQKSDDPGARAQQLRVKKQADILLSLNPKILDSLENGFSYYNGTQTPLEYDPQTGILVTVLRGGIEGDPVFNRNRGFLRYSTDLGDTWSESLGPLQDPGENVQDSLRYPNVAIHSPEGASSIADLTFVHSNPFVNGGWGYYGIGFTFGDAPDPFEIAVPPFVIEGEEYSWLPGTCLTIAPDGQTGIAFVHLDAPEFALPVQNNNIGMIRYNFAEDDEPVAMVPPPFQTTVFDEPQDIGTTAAEDLRTNRMVQIDWHNNDLYVGVIGEHRENGNAAWDVPMVIKTSDLGDSWTEWDYMPEQVFIDFLTGLGAVFPTNDVYFLLGQDMQVIGEDHVIFVCSLVENVDGGTLDRILELEYRSGEWTIRAIGLNTGTFQSFFGSQADFDNNDGDQPQTLPDIQISITEDNNPDTPEFMLAKWVDLVPYTVVINGEETEITAYDIFFTAREIGVDSWGPVVNVTNSIFHEKTTWMPRTLPSLREVPFITNRTNFATNAWLNSQEDPTDSLNLNIAQRQIFDNQHVMYAKLDLYDVLIGSSVGEGESLPKATNVAITPNPVAAQATISFTLPNNGVAQVNVFDLFGRKVATLQDGMLPAGPHSLSFEAGERTGGTYFVQVTLDGASVAESFVISR